MMRRGLLAMSRSRRLAGAITTNRLAWSAAGRFVAGSKLDDAAAVVRRLNDAGMAASLDHLGENTSRREDAERARDAYVAAASRIRDEGLHAGISLKLTSLGLGLDRSLAERMLGEVVAHAASLDPPVFVRIDMEDSSRVQATLDIFHDLFGRHRNVGVVIQSYLYRSKEDVERLIADGAGVRMVKGAYLEPRTAAYPDKKDVDEAFVRLSTRLLATDARATGTYLALATHDPAIIDWAKRHTAREGIPKDSFEFQMLYGIRRDLQSALGAGGYRMRIYVPYGSEWYPYFMRRLAERPQNVMFLARNVATEILPGGR
jgi:proline dehydrogenase